MEHGQAGSAEVETMGRATSTELHAQERSAEALAEAVDATSTIHRRRFRISGVAHSPAPIDEGFQTKVQAVGYTTGNVLGHRRHPKAKRFYLTSFGVTPASTNSLYMSKATAFSTWRPIMGHRRAEALPASSTAETGKRVTSLAQMLSASSGFRSPAASLTYNRVKAM